MQNLFLGLEKNGSKLIDFKFENKLNKTIIGVDEVGRGPWAGPVIAVACLFIDNKSNLIDLTLFDDSKKLTKQKRSICYKHILYLKKKSLIKFYIGEASVEEIDNINILQASMLAMSRAIKSFPNKYSKKALIIIDGNKQPKLKNFNIKTIIKGDEKSLSTAAASIIAKIHRDKIMKELSKIAPGYGWESNMGYGTAKHIDALKSIGISKYHRKSFRPIKALIHNNY